MSDNFPASISIGGELILESPYGMLQKDWDEMINEFYECINGSFRDFEENPYNLSSIHDLENNLNSSGHLKICDSQALNGCFQDIEKLCKNLFLSFDRISDAYYEYDGEYSSYRPDQKPKEETFKADQSGRIMIPLSDIEGLYSIVNKRELYDSNSNTSKMREALKEIRTTIELVLPKHRELPKFSIKDKE